MELRTWDPLEWLEVNYCRQNGLPDFFTIAELEHDQSAAENKYKDCVNDLQCSDDHHVQEWAREMIRNNFICLASSDVSSFWAAHYTMRNLVDKVVGAEKRKWTIITQESYEQDKPRSTVAKRQALPRHIGIDERDNINVAGLSCSVGTHIKMLALAEIDRFDQLDEKSKYLVTIGMNGVLDLTDASEGSQFASLNIAQREELGKLEWEVPASHWMKPRDVEFFNYLKAAKVKRNWKHVLDKIDARFRQSALASDRSRIYQICRHFVELHWFEPYLFSRDMVKNVLSEADYIIKIWGHPIELLFRGSPLLTHWGDTVSKNADKLQHKMDLRIMSNEFIHDYDIGNAEFARCTSGKKYFLDKAKLVSNGKSQLNEIVKKFRGSQVKDIKVCLFQVMAFQVDVYCMWLEANGLYVLQRVTAFSAPVKMNTFGHCLEELICGLLTMKEICLDTEEIYSDSDKTQHKKDIADHTSSSSKNPLYNAWCRPIWRPVRNDEE